MSEKKQKKPQKETPLKEIDGLVYSMHDGSGLARAGADKALDVAKGKLGFVDNWISEIVPAAIKITALNGKSIKAAGYKQIGDQGDLKVTAIQLPDGNVLGLDKPFVVEFDKEDAPSKGKIKGTIKNDSARLLIDKVRNHPDLKNMPESKELLDDFLKGQSTLAKIVDKNDFQNLASASVTENAPPKLVAVVHNDKSSYLS